MNSDLRDRRRNLRLIISESIMVLAVILTVIVLALIASGYWLNADTSGGLTVERQGMLQVNSTPTGATVTIDGTAWSWLDRTNASKVLSAGQHTVTLSRDSYDTWTRTISIREGLLYRLQYPRLFLTERTTESVYDLEGYNFATASPDGRCLLLAGNTTDWLLLNLESDTLDPRPVDISQIFTSVSVANGAAIGLFTGEFISADWSQDSNHILFNIKTTSGGTEWVILDPKTPKNSVNLTATLAQDLSDVQILDDSASNLLAVIDGNLHKISASAHEISPILAEKVQNFDHYGSEIVFVAENSATTDTISSVSPYYLGLTRVGDATPTPAITLSEPARVVISKFYDSHYITVLSGTTATLYLKNDFSAALQEYELGFTPASISVGHDSEFIQMTAPVDGKIQFATLDMEAQAVREWATTSTHYGKLDYNMYYAVSGGELTVYDPDGQNARVLATGVSSHFPVAIASNKWLYYCADDELIRMMIVK